MPIRLVDKARILLLNFPVDLRGFPTSLPEFQKVFPDDAACAKYLESVRWPNGFTCPTCGHTDKPYRFPSRSSVVLRCRKCRRNASLTASTVMQSTHTPLSTWFWGAYLVTTQTPGQSALQFQRQLGLSRYETAFQILHKLRSGMVRPERDSIGGEYPVEVDECFVGGRTRGEGGGVHHMATVIGAVEVRVRKDAKQRAAKAPAGTAPVKKLVYAGRLRLRVIEDRRGPGLLSFVTENVATGSIVRTDGFYPLSGIITGQLPTLPSSHCWRSRQGRRTPSNDPPCILKPKNLDSGDASWCHRPTPLAGISQRIRVPVQPALLSNDGL
jgi:hypothetical protein